MENLGFIMIVMVTFNISGSWNNNNLPEGYISPGSSGTRVFNLTTTSFSINFPLKMEIFFF